jgi:hypothetical protein
MTGSNAGSGRLNVFPKNIYITRLMASGKRKASLIHDLNYIE